MFFIVRFFHDLHCTSKAFSTDITVVDGDTLKIGIRTIRLFGIDAPESKQRCYDFEGQPWECGLVAKYFLEKLIAIRPVKCLTNSTDLYNREVAICFAGGEELNRTMVQEGMALAYKQYSKKYLKEELAAKKQFLGIWSSSFMEPELWRRYKKHKAKAVKSIQNQPQ
jgi:endonuclease YncB( thermonuclease family)